MFYDDKPILTIQSNLTKYKLNKRLEYIGTQNQSMPHSLQGKPESFTTQGSSSDGAFLLKGVDMSCCGEDDLKELEKMGVAGENSIVQAITFIVCMTGVFLIIFGALIIKGVAQ